MDLKETPYYIGLDCGTDSIGFAVTDKNYNLLKAQHKDMWGSHLFDEANTAEARRIQRNARKRLNRRKERIDILQGIFAEEMAKVDNTFFLRLNESSLWQEDRSNNNKQRFSLFNDKSYTDKEFKKDFSTIYHLRAALLEGQATTKTGHDLHDIRFLYLAMHHIIKNRGHFLFPGDGTTIQNPEEIWKALCESYESIYTPESDDDEYEPIFGYSEELAKALAIQKRSERIDNLTNLICSNKKRNKDLAKAMAGYSVNIRNLFDNEEYADLPKLDFSKASFEESDLPVLEDSLQEDEYKLVESLKALYDYSLLSNIMEGGNSLSEAKVKQYNKNKEDIKRLKSLVKKYCSEKEFEEFFHSNKAGSFSSYIGSINNDKLKKNDHMRVKRSNTDDFYKEIKKLLAKAPEDDEEAKKIAEDINNASFYPLLRSFRNGIVPYQVNLLELKQILDNAKSYLPWLNIKDEEGLTPKDKIVSMMKFRIPYYVGPLTTSDKSKNAWLVRKESGKIYAWNFEKKVDISKSAEKFITRMTNKCTYLPDKDVIPKQSLLYQKYMVLNEINKLKFNNQDITVDQKPTIYKELFEDGIGNVTQNKIKKLAYSHCWIRKGEELNLTGIDTTIKSSLSSYKKFKPYMGENKLKEKDVEEIIKQLTLFSDGGKIVEDNIRKAFSNKLTKDEIKQISRFKFSGWGNFSREFLTETLSKKDQKSIMQLLWDTNLNLMELIHNKAIFNIDDLGNNKKIGKIEYSILEDLRISPKVRRQIWQALRIEQEIEHIMGHKPEKIFIEMTRYAGEKGKRTKTRKEQLIELMDNDENKEIISAYSSGIKLKPAEFANLKTKLSNANSDEITKRDKLYLYYTQLGRCMYSGEPIDLEDLLGPSNKYDIDHIYPYSKSQDDSLDNKVIVKSELNREKANYYPIPPKVLPKDDKLKELQEFWKGLCKKGLISSEKLKRITRTTPFSDDELKGFINRQLVETSQSTKALATILRQYLGDEGSVIYSKAKSVSDFRKDFNLPKSRSLNHLHHAKDAYLNIVVGNTLHTKYTANWFLRDLNSDSKEKDQRATFNDPYKYNVPGAWIADNNETLSLVKETMEKNTVLFTRQPEMRTGQLFDLNLVPKGSKNGIIPAKITKQLQDQIKKSNDKEATIKAWTDKYGGYNSLAISHFALVKHTEKKKSVYTFVRIPIIRAKELIDKNKLYKYCEEEMEYKDTEIVRTKVLFNTLLSVDGFLMTLTSSVSNGAQLGLESSIPLLLSNDDTYYVKKLEKFTNNKKLDKNLLVDEKHDDISREKNITLYETLLKKSKMPLYRNRPANSSLIIENGKSIFCELSVEQQVQVLMSIVTYLSMSFGRADFALIKGGTGNGELKIGSTIDPSKKKVFLIDQSITGIYEERLELK